MYSNFGYLYIIDLQILSKSMALSAEQTLILVLFYVSTKGEHGIETKIPTFLDWFFPKNLLLKPAATRE